MVFKAFSIIYIKIIREEWGSLRQLFTVGSILKSFSCI